MARLLPVDEAGWGPTGGRGGLTTHPATGATAGVDAHGSDKDGSPIPSRLTPRGTWRRLRMAGWTADEAGNLVAHLAGLPVGRTAWTLREVENLLFIATLVDGGRIRA